MELLAPSWRVGLSSNLRSAVFPRARGGWIDVRRSWASRLARMKSYRRGDGAVGDPFQRRALGRQRDELSSSIPVNGEQYSLSSHLSRSELVRAEVKEREPTVRKKEGEQDATGEITCERLLRCYSTE